MTRARTNVTTVEWRRNEIWKWGGHPFGAKHRKIFWSCTFLALKVQLVVLVSPPCPAICKNGGTWPLVPYGVGVIATASRGRQCRTLRISRSAAKQARTVAVTCARRVTSELMYTPKLRTTLTGWTSDVHMRTEAVGIWCWRRDEEHQSTSVFCGSVADGWPSSTSKHHRRSRTCDVVVRLCSSDDSICVSSA